MDKSWMKKRRSSRDYLQGVNDFLNFASLNASKDGTISCPCVKCVNSYMLNVAAVHDHLVSFGISQCYDCWYYHGETLSTATSSKTCETRDEDMHLDYGDMHDLLNDVFPMHARSVDEVNASEPTNESPSVEQSTQVPNTNAQKFYELLKDAEQPLYEGCNTFSKLSAVLHLYHVKCLKGLTNDTFTIILQILKDMLPSDAKLPKDCYEAKKIIKGLALGYEKIHACPNDCMLFWKKHAKDDFCKCGASRWAVDEINVGLNLSNSSKKVKKNPVKILRWFLVISRLQRWFMCSKIAPSMKWHAEGRTKDQKMRHPADSPAWKERYGRVLGLGFGHTPKNSGSTSNSSTRLRMTSEEERMRDKETIQELKDIVHTQAGELNTLRRQVDFLLRQSGFQVLDGVNGSHDQASSHTHQGSSSASHDIELCGNRTI